MHGAQPDLGCCGPKTSSLEKKMRLSLIWVYLRSYVIGTTRLGGGGRSRSCPELPMPLGVVADVEAIADIRQEPET